jgi:hypothetical protein
MKVRRSPGKFDVLGNGDSSFLFASMARKPRQRKLYICNLPPFGVNDVEATFMVDFKMMMALTEGSLELSHYQWILGNRPKIWMEKSPTFNLRFSQNVKEFYLTVPEYAKNATNFNCGHFGVHYLANRKNAKEIHLWGFDSIFDHNMRSVTDLVLSSDRSELNNHRLLTNWRPVWTGIFKEFPSTKFVLHHTHKNIKIDVPDNVEIVVHEKNGSVQAA